MFLASAPSSPSHAHQSHITSLWRVAARPAAQSSHSASASPLPSASPAATLQHQEFTAHVTGLSANLSAPLLARLRLLAALYTPPSPQSAPDYTPPPPPLESNGSAKVVGHVLAKFRLPQAPADGDHFVVQQLETLLSRRWAGLVRNNSSAVRYKIFFNSTFQIYYDIGSVFVNEHIFKCGK